MNPCNKFHFPCAFPPVTSGSTGPTGATGTTGPLATANNINIVETIPFTVALNAPIPMDFIAHQEGTTITFLPPTDILLEGGRTYLVISYDYTESIAYFFILGCILFC
ncbi:hypothetical protein [Bacillus wiedmannii]|uniref:hypothetical protein n=1 Tax=Bacillus wiedmannii TaxID=1890302 RepID=UPI001155BFC4|nr:hypothetical protein [Bacillus wiedmannii]